MNANFSNDLFTPLFQEVSYKIEVLEVDKEIFENETPYIIEWLKSKAGQLGCGVWSEYYTRNEDFREDIHIIFKISINSK